MNETHRFVVLGTGGAFTSTVVRTLLEKKQRPVALIQPAYNAQQKRQFVGIPIDVTAQPNGLSQLLQARTIPVYYPSSKQLAERIKKLEVDFLLVACWPGLLSDRVLGSVARAALNLHPSLLPRYRGRDPLAAQLAAHEGRVGVTLHLLNTQFDAGDIVLQAELGLKYEDDQRALEVTAAKKGAELFIEALGTYHRPGWQLTRQND